MKRSLFVLAAAGLWSAFSFAQDAQSLGDLARQVRAQKQQHDVQAKDGAVSKTSSDSKEDSASATASRPKTSRVITNDDSPNVQDQSLIVSRQASPKSDNDAEKSGNRDEQGQNWKSRIQAQKEAIASLQSQMTELSGSIQYAGQNCVANCEKWNEHQQQKQEQVETMKAQLGEQKKHLEEMQDEARKQGFGSSIYEP